MSPLLQIEGVTKRYSSSRAIMSDESRDAQGLITAVNAVSLEVNVGQTVGLVGQSGSGKTTLGRLVLKLEPPSAGRILFENEDISLLRGKQLKDFRSKVQMIFQDPYESLDPRLSLKSTLEEPLIVHGIRNKSEMMMRIDDALTKVGLTPAHRFINLRPDQLSGGQRQRAAIARALILRPKLVVADEPVSMLDVSVSAEILNLMLHLKKTMNIAYLFITHNLAHAAYFCDRICVMSQGQVIEEGFSEKILRNPEAEYTKNLISSIPLYSHN
jgi:peptide/nickel transport system ATP-binding protein